MQVYFAKLDSIDLGIMHPSTGMTREILDNILLSQAYDIVIQLVNLSGWGAKRTFSAKISLFGNRTIYHGLCAHPF